MITGRIRAAPTHLPSGSHHDPFRACAIQARLTGLCAQTGIWQAAKGSVLNAIVCCPVPNVPSDRAVCCWRSVLDGGHFSSRTPGTLLTELVTHTEGIEGRRGRGRGYPLVNQKTAT